MTKVRVESVLIESLPCPYCNKDNNTRSWVRTTYHHPCKSKPAQLPTYNVMCLACKSIGPEAYTRGTAIKLWNKRVDFAEEVAKLRSTITHLRQTYQTAAVTSAALKASKGV